jgi:hypothetical protein
MTTQEAIKTFVELYVPIEQQARATQMLELIVQMASVRGAADELRAVRRRGK